MRLFLNKLDKPICTYSLAYLGMCGKIPFAVSNKMNTSPFYSYDVRGPSNIPNVSFAHWFIIFICDYTRFTWMFLLKQKFKVNSVVQCFFPMIKNQFGVNI